jgi:hypothetical protein
VSGSHAINIIAKFTGITKMSLLGKNIQLKGVSQKGKNRVRENGDRWTVLAETDRVLFSPGTAGPWLFVAVVGKSQDDKSSRWIRATDDTDFIVLIPND